MKLATMKGHPTNCSGCPACSPAAARLLRMDATELGQFYKARDAGRDTKRVLRVAKVPQRKAEPELAGLERFAAPDGYQLGTKPPARLSPMLRGWVPALPAPPSVDLATLERNTAPDAYGLRKRGAA